MARALHHAAICTRDVDRALAFYRDGLGLDVLMDQEFTGDWRGLFDARGDRLRSVFLGDPSSAHAGIVELVAFPAGLADGPGPLKEPAAGFFLLSFFVGDVDATLERLASYGFDEPARRIEVPSPAGAVAMATVHDPDGTLVELIGDPRAASD